MWTSLKRGAKRILSTVALALLMIWVVDTFPIFFGPVLAPFIRNLGLIGLAVSAADILIRIVQPYVDTGEAARKGMAGDEAASRVYLARCIFFSVVMFLFVFGAKAETVQPPMGYIQNAFLAYPPDTDLTRWSTTKTKTSVDLSAMPANAQKNYPLLLKERQAHWPDMLAASLLGAQIEQETCYKLTHPKCWTSNAKLDITSKHGTELGGGFGQLTKVTRANGQVRFDNLSMMSLKYPKELGNYSWDNWNDPELSMRAYVLFMRDTCKSIRGAATTLDMFQMCLSAYNGGLGGLNNDILSCRATPGCNPTVWKGNVELTSAKAKTAVPGYGQSAYAINRGYVDNVSVKRRARYLALDQLVA